MSEIAPTRCGSGLRAYVASISLALMATCLIVGPISAADPVKPDLPVKTEKELKIEGLVEKARQHIEKSEWVQATKLADEALVVDPAAGAPIVIRGIVLNGKGEYDAAIVEFERVTALTGRDATSVANRADAYTNRSFSLHQKGEYLKAIDSAYFAILEKGDYVPAYMHRGMAYIGRRQYDKAINNFNHVINLDPKSGEAYSNRGLAYRLKGNFDQSIADQNKALELQAGLPIAIERLAAAKIAKGDANGAYAELEKVLKAKPDFPEALCDRSQLYAMKGDTTSALNDLDTAHRIDPKFARVPMQRGVIYMMQNKYDDAIKNLDEAITLRANYAEAYCVRGYAKHGKKEFALAVTDFTKAIELDPAMVQAYSGRNQAYKKLNKNVEAGADAAKIKELQPAPVSESTKKKLAADKKKLDEKKKAEPPENRFLVTSKAVDPAKRAAAMKSAAEIDRLVAANYVKFKIKPNDKTSDAEFLRRIYLDITGTIPTYQQAQKFLASHEPNKRADLIDELLSSDGYASHYFNYWVDVLRYTDNLSPELRGEPYRQWIKQSLAESKPWDKMVQEMITAEGVVWENPASGYLQRDANMPLDNMNNTVRIFLGTRIGCAQCHNHPFDRWTQKEFYEMAAFTFGTITTGGGGDTRFWSKNPNDRLMEEYYQLEQEEEDRRINYYRFTRMIRVNMKVVNDIPGRKVTLPPDYAYDDAKPKQVIEPKVLFGKQPEIKANEPPRKAFARWLISKDNPRFALTVANRLWKQAFGTGQIEPVDDMMDSTVAENPELMTFLEAEMKRLDFDMKEYLRVLFNSETYQRQACTEEVNPGMPYHFAGPNLRRLSAEQVWDSFLTLAVVKPDEFRELKAQTRTSFVGVDLNKIPASDLLMADTKGNEVDYSLGTRQAKYTYKGVLLARASELPSPVPAGHFLRMFGQSDRELISGSSTFGSVPQVLFMFNGPITHMLLEKNSTIYNNVVKKQSIPEGIKAIFLTVLSREPDEDELKLGVKEVKERGPAGYGNVIWSLVNTREFLFVQ